MSKWSDLRAVPAMGYCDSPDEIAKNPNGRRDLEQIAAGNKDAFRFMWVFWNFTHLYDDLVDRDKTVSVEHAAKALIDFVVELSSNAFYRSNVQALLPHIISAANRWCDGEEWERRGSAEQVAAAHVVKCGDLDLYLQVAYLVGGWDHMRAMKHTRSYDPIDVKG